MKPLTFVLLLLVQRVDDALDRERRRPKPNPLLLSLLRQRKRRLNARLRRSPAQRALAGS
jgi:hypothetical protein